MSFLSYSKDFVGLPEVMLHNPKRYLPLMQLSTDLMNGESELSRPQREAIARTVSEVNSCHYCVGVHSAVVEELRKAMSSKGSDPFRDVQRFEPILAYAEKLTRTPAQIVQADVDAIRDAGWSEQTVEDVINITALFNQLNRILDGLGIRGTSEHFDEAGTMLATNYGDFLLALKAQTETARAQRYNSGAVLGEEKIPHE